MAIYAYIRVSHIDSTLGLSPENQIDCAKAYKELIDGDWGTVGYHSSPDGVVIPGVVVDLIQSAWRKPLSKRPGGQFLLRTLKPGDQVIFYAIDRGFRSVGDFSITVKSWLSRGIKPHFIREQLDLSTANGLAIGHVVAAMAEWQSHVKSERIREALALKRTKREKIPEQRTRHEWDRSEFDFTEPIIECTTSGTIYRYIRVSHAYQVQGISLAAQEEITRKYSEYLTRTTPGLTIGQAFVDEAQSAFKIPLAKRNKGKELCDILQPGDHVVVSRLDRGWRSAHDLLATVTDWTARGITVHFADSRTSTSSQSGKMFLMLLGTLAEMESEVKSKISKDNATYRKKNGLPYGRIPFGFKVATVNGKQKIAPDLEEIRIARMVHRLRKRKISYDRISDRIEHWFARLEKRKPISRAGTMFCPGRKTQSRVGLIHRKYSARIIRQAEAAWPRLEKIWNKIRKIDEQVAAGKA